jgi:hypothetical protein
MAEYHQICFRKHESGNGQTRGKNRKSTFVPTAFNFFGRFDIFTRGMITLLTKSEVVLLCSGPMSLHPHVKSDLLVSK